MIRTGVQYVTPQGGLTKAGYDALQGLDGALQGLADALVRLAAVEAKLNAIGAVVAPVGGVTVDAQARAAIAAIIAAA